MIKDILLKDYPVLSPYDSTTTAVGKLKSSTFIVVMDENNFIGLLTSMDLLFKRKVLVGDTLKPKPSVRSSESVLKALSIIMESGFPALPCIDNDCFLGVLTEENACSWICKKAMGEQTEINITNIIGDENEENIKSSFLKTILHYTINPLQVLYSGFKLLQTEDLNIEQKDILYSMYNATRKLDSVISTYASEYLEELR